MSTTVAQVLQVKGNDVHSVAPDAPVYEALKLMAEKEVGALVVLDGEKLVGIMSERDYARKVVLRGKSSKDTPVREIMTRKVVCVQPEQLIEDCMGLMTEKHIRHLPVEQDEKIIGVISIGDVVKAMIADREFLIQQLEMYITGSSSR